MCRRERQRFCQIVLSPLDQEAPPHQSRFAGRDVAVGLLKEKSVMEMKLIQKGKIKELKEKYSIVKL